MSVGKWEVSALLLMRGEERRREEKRLEGEREREGEMNLGGSDEKDVYGSMKLWRGRGPWNDLRGTEALLMGIDKEDWMEWKAESLCFW